MRLTNEMLKLWAQFYLRLIATTIWNASLKWATVVLGAESAQAFTLVDIRTISFTDAWYTLGFTILWSIVFEINQHPLPKPSEPSMDATDPPLTL